MTPQRSPASPPPKRRHRPPSASAAGAVSLPNEIIFEILSRVPVWSACRLRRVSKEWRALVSDPSFVSAHKSRHAEPLVAVFSVREEPSKGDELRLFDIDGNVVSRRVVKGGGGSPGKFSASCRHDLICVTDGHTGARLVDPAAGEVVATIPRLKQNPTPYEAWANLATRMNTTTGFGRAAPSGAYKVVRLVDGRSCWVLTLGDGSPWRRRLPPPTRVTPYPGSMTVVNGVFYVLASYEMDGVLGDVIHCFDLESEEWTETMKSPQKNAGDELWRKTTKTVGLADLNGTLCMVQSEVRFVNMWLLTTDCKKSVWVKAYTIRMTPKTYHYVPLRVTHDGTRLLFQCSLFRTRSQVVKSYNLCTKICTTVIETPDNLESKISLCNLYLHSFLPAKV